MCFAYPIIKRYKKKEKVIYKVLFIIEYLSFKKRYMSHCTRATTEGAQSKFSDFAEQYPML